MGGKKKPKKLKPGTIAPESGQYIDSTTGNEITGVKGKRLPPTSKPGGTFNLVDRTKHKTKKKSS